MNAARLLEYFDRIAEAPDAISRLRKFILDLAVRGKLVEQDPNDEPASELLKKIGFRHTTGGAFEDGFPRYLLPVGWVWSTLQSLSDKIHYGFTASADKSCKKVRLLRISDIQNNGVDWTTVPGCVIDEKDVERYKLESGDILIARTGGTIGKTFLVESAPVVSVFASYLIRVKASKELFGKYVKFFLESPVYWTQLYDGARGAGQPNVNGQTLGKLAIPLPPLAEQHRIVAKVDELMALCDRLEASQAKRESRRDRLASASLKRIGQPEDVGNGEELRENVRFHLHHLPRLATRPEHVKELRQTILNLAVRGKLVPQDPSDEPASELLKNIHAEKLRLIKLKLIRNEKTLPVVSPIEEPFVVSRGWIWARIGTCAAFTDYGTSCQAIERDDGIPVLKMGDIQDGRVVLGYHKKVPVTLEDLPGLFLQKFDLLYNRTNSAELVGKTGIFLGEDGRFTFASYLIRIRFFLDFTNPIYVNYAMNSPYFRETQIVPELKQQCGQANVNGTKLRNMVIPLPPLAEQHRIVAKVDELMNLCDKLEIHLAANQTNQSLLLEATLCDALGVTCLPVSRPSRPTPSPTRIAARPSELPSKPITPRPVEAPKSIVQGSLIDQPMPKVENPHATSGDIPSAILAQMKPGQEYSRAQLTEALGLSVSRWNMAIRELKESGRVVQAGERRGARYRIG